LKVTKRNPDRKIRAANAKRNHKQPAAPLWAYRSVHTAK